MTSTGEMNPDKRIPLFVREGFWKRQINQNPTEPQKWFDILFGIVLVITYIGSKPWQPLADRLTFYVYVFLVLALVCLGLFKTQWMQKIGEFLAGVFLSGFVAAFFVGLSFLFKHWQLGFSFVHFMGVTPIFVAVVLLRNSLRAWRLSEDPNKRKNDRFCLFLLGIFALPALTSLISQLLIHPILDP